MGVGEPVAVPRATVGAEDFPVESWPLEAALSTSPELLRFVPDITVAYRATAPRHLHNAKAGHL
jgi:hypothetical protein